MTYKKYSINRILATFFIVAALLASVCQTTVYAASVSTITAQTETHQDETKAEYIRQYDLNIHNKGKIQHPGSELSNLLQSTATQLQPAANFRSLPIHGDIHYLHILYLF